MVNYVKVGSVSDFNPGDAPIDISEVVQDAYPAAERRIITRLADQPCGDPAFASVGLFCTHQGCNLLKGGSWGRTDQPIYDPASQTITCPCHRSRFDVETGAVKSRPATQPLPRFAVQVVGEDVQVSVERIQDESWARPKSST